MILSKEVQVRWNGSTRKYYESLGYEWTGQNNWFTVKIEDLIKTSPVKVEVKCDYCGEEFLKSYRDIFKKAVDKICCKNRKCMIKKTEETYMLLYGVKSHMQLEKYKEKSSKRNREDVKNVLKCCEEKGLRVLNIEDYKNDRTRLIIVCEKHSSFGEIETNFANIKKSKHCCKYSKHDNNSKKLDGNIVYQEFINNGLTPMFKPEEYKNNSQKLPYTCDSHIDKGIQYRSYSNLKYCEGCYYCAKEKASDDIRKSEEEVFKYFASRNLRVLDGERYKNKDCKIKYVCVNHNSEIQESTYGNLKRIDEPCDFCRNEKSLTKLSRKLRSTISSWRKLSEKDNNYKCILTGSDEYEVHHLISFNTILKESLNELKLEIKDYYDGFEIEIIKNKVKEKHNELLGVCLKKDLHILFHQIFSKENNTVEQFEEFKTRYLNGEFN